MRATDILTGLTASRLREVLHYDPDTGRFVWRVQKSNVVKVGDDAGACDGEYLACWVDGRRYYLHRLAWLYMTGAWPLQVIDHIDGVKTHNAWGNLREASNADNQRNMGLKANNTSGRKGVYFERRRGKWRAQISEHGRTRMIGRYPTREEAYEAFCNEATRVHGEFARLT